jgi:hypothetical protein
MWMPVKTVRNFPGIFERMQRLRHALKIMEVILSSSYTCTLPAITQTSNVPGHVLVWNFCFHFGNREYSRMDPSGWPRGTLYPQKLELTSPISVGRSVGIVRSLTQAMEFSFFFFLVFGKLCSQFVYTFEKQSAQFLLFKCFKDQLMSIWFSVYLEHSPLDDDK